jgi:hypothetical protein
VDTSLSGGDDNAAELPDLGENRELSRRHSHMDGPLRDWVVVSDRLGCPVVLVRREAGPSGFAREHRGVSLLMLQMLPYLVLVSVNGR